ncbi:MAG: universal stress protein, partial [Actinomycetota bacterium]|nr:universal stress protein [Actinomycetota bacterium]
MGVVVVGYVPKPEGKAALRLAAEEAKLRNASLVVVNSHRGGREFDREDAMDSESQLEEVRDQLK